MRYDPGLKDKYMYVCMNVCTYTYRRRRRRRRKECLFFMSDDGLAERFVDDGISRKIC